jgi:hypothetical protein
VRSGTPAGVATSPEALEMNTLFPELICAEKGAGWRVGGLLSGQERRACQSQRKNHGDHRLLENSEHGMFKLTVLEKRKLKPAIKFRRSGGDESR